MSNLHDKIKKIHQLSVSGIDGEMITAKRLLAEICKKHSITLEEVFSEKLEEFEIKITSVDNQYLFTHCVKKIDNYVKVRYYIEDKQTKIVVTTKIKWLQIIDLYNFHKKQFALEKKKIIYSFEQAYYSKHDLFYRQAQAEQPSKSDTDIDLAQFLAIYKTLDNTIYLKALQ